MFANSSYIFLESESSDNISNFENWDKLIGLVIWNSLLKLVFLN